MLYITLETKRRGGLRVISIQAGKLPEWSLQLILISVVIFILPFDSFIIAVGSSDDNL